MVQECILNTVRESIPVEAILKAYMDETVEEDVQEEVKEQVIEEPIKNPNQDSIVNTESNSNAILPSTSTPSSTLSFDNIDYARDETGIVERVEAPKTIDRLEEISEQRAQQRKLESDEDDDDEKDSFQERLKISDQTVDLTHLDIHSMDPPEMSLLPDLLIDDIEMLE
jgi:hypothetical protein